MSILQDRIKKAISKWEQNHGKFNKAAFGKASGTTRATATGWINGPTKSIDSALLFDAANYLEVNAQWLATGKGPMILAVKAERYYPLLGWDESRDWNSDNQQNSADPVKERIVCPVDALSDNTYVLAVDDGSMRPRFSEGQGQLIWVDPDIDIYDGCFAVINTGEESPNLRQLIKERGIWKYQALSPKYRDFELQPLGDRKVYGVVGYHGQSIFN